jgi:hypothetical protein
VELPRRATRPAAAQPRRHVLGARRLELAVDHRGDPLRDLRVSEGRELSLWIVHPAGRDFDEPSGQSFGDLPGIARHPYPGGVDAGPSSVFDDG